MDLGVRNVHTMDIKTVEKDGKVYRLAVFKSLFNQMITKTR